MWSGKINYKSHILELVDRDMWLFSWIKLHLVFIPWKSKLPMKILVFHYTSSSTVRSSVAYSNVNTGVHFILLYAKS